MRRITAVSCVIVFACTGLCGCESLVKKFVRKPKEPRRPAEVVLEPHDYAKNPGGSELYGEYFLFWKSWHDEFISALSTASGKRQSDTVKEALKNLADMRRCLDSESQRKLDPYIARLEKLARDSSLDTYHAQARVFSVEADSIRRLIMNDFSPERVKDHLL